VNRYYRPADRQSSGITTLSRQPKRKADLAGVSREIGSATVTTRTPLCPFEHVEDPDLEARQIDETARLTVELLQKRYPPPRPVLRGVHPKSHGCVQASFTVSADVPPELQVGLFAQPGRQFAAIVRFSNAAALEGPDVDCRGRQEAPTKPDKHGSRGMAVKVLDVGGEVLAQDGGACNQDFLMINQPVFAFANAEDYLRLDRILAARGDDPVGFFAPLRAQDPTLSAPDREAILKYIKDEHIGADAIRRILDTKTIIDGIQATPVANPLGIQYFGAAPFLFGPDRVMKFSARPCAEVQPTAIPDPTQEHYLREVLRKAMQQTGTVEFDFMVQVRGGGNDLGIENASTAWNETTHPFAKVAKITIVAPQDIDSAEQKAECERLVFTPWHSLAAHQPIGSINRLRKAVYEASPAR
jgi:hypothetical protein